MIPFLHSVVAAVSAPDSKPLELVTYEFRRLGEFEDPRLLWLLLIIAGVLITAYVTWFYRRERAALPGLVRLLCPALRVIAWIGAAMFFLGLERRVDQQIVTDSEVVLLVDTSQSMSVEDENPESREPVSRGESVAQTLRDSPLVASLRESHKVSLLTFDRDLSEISTWERQQVTADEDAPQAEEGINWQEALQPRGSETRLGDALRQVALAQRDGPLAGVILVTDGVQNIGLDPLSQTSEFQEKQAPIFPIGIGSNEPRRNLRAQDLIAPTRVYPEDRATVTGVIHGEGFAGRTIPVQLVARELAQDAGAESVIAEESVTFGSEQETKTLEFEIEPAVVGRLALRLKINAPREDQYAGDNQREIEVEVVEASTKVLLIAGGASRDYQFMRNQLFRDRHATVDVWIQSAEGAISQEADLILREFPSSKEELYQYDCIVAFDPNWELLDARQAEMLESWVAEQAGGLIAIAGPIHTQTWSQNPELGKIRALYPVEFQRRLTLLDDGLYGSKTPWPIIFTREGEEAEYLWLANNDAESRLLWAEFPGVYGCYAVKGAKPGARVLGWYGDPEASLTSEYPVYLAEQFYGSGRVFYLGSGELWRLRALGPAYFEVLTTRLIRHVSQGRLMKGSSRGRLLVDQDRYSVGDEVVVRAQLLAESREPFVAEKVIAQVISEGSRNVNLPLLADKNRPGNFIGQFTVKQEGSYRIELSVPDSVDEQLTRRIQVVLPNLEFEETKRNDQLLAALASQSGGQYYTSLNAAVSGDDQMKPVDQFIASRAETRTLRGTPDAKFSEWINRWLLAAICGALCLEWLLRRLMKLA